MFNQNSKNIKALDLQISKNIEELGIVEDENKELEIMDRLEKLNSLRTELVESKERVSQKSTIITSIFGLASVILVLKYEETDIITSKAFNTATRMIKG